jgi:hypothetical protein
MSRLDQKQTLSAVCNPLKDASILQQVFSYLPGHWLYLGAVCSEWKAAYACIHCVQVVSSSGRNVWKKLVTCQPNTTLCSAAFVSPATAGLACACGLQICINESMQMVAGLHADVETLTALLELGMPLTDAVVNAVALSGRLNILQHLFTEHHCPLAVPDVLSFNAARSGSIIMLDWLRKKSFCEHDDFTCTGAAIAGCLAALQHLINEGCDWDRVYIPCYAASSGCIEMMEWLQQQHGAQFDEDAMAYAAGAGQTAMCQYLRSMSCAWDTTACGRAASAGHLDVLRWLREQGCPWDVNEVCIEAANNELIVILDYLIEAGEELDAELLTDALNLAGSRNKLLAVQWLRQHGAQWPAVLKHGTQQWSGESLAWARAEGCTSPVTL